MITKRTPKARKKSRPGARWRGAAGRTPPGGHPRPSDKSGRCRHSEKALCVGTIPLLRPSGSHTRFSTADWILMAKDTLSSTTVHEKPLFQTPRWDHPQHLHSIFRRSSGRFGLKLKANSFDHVDSETIFNTPLYSFFLRKTLHLQSSLANPNSEGTST